MRHGSLFSGIGGFDLAAEWMGWENVFHCEKEKFCQQVLNYYWPKATLHEDIRNTDFTIYRGQIDILTGGFPCQPYSTAGKRLGKEDDRHLWPEMLRAIREISPRWIVGENVRGLISWNGGMVFDEVQADLEAAGYEVLPFLLPAAGVGAPHRRDRVWFVAKNTDSNGRRGKFRKEEPKVRRFRDACTGNNERIQTNDGEDGIAPNTKSNGDRGGLFGMEEKNGKIRQPKEHRKNYRKPRHNGKERDATNTNQPGLQATRTEQQATGVEQHRELGGATAAYADGKRLRGESDWVGESGLSSQESEGDYWANFPTQPPVRSRNDGLPSDTHRRTIQNENTMDRSELIFYALKDKRLVVDFETGKIYSTVIRGKKGGKVELKGAYCNGYVVHNIYYKGVKKQCRAHQIVWIAANGLYDKDVLMIDHINRDRTDNRLVNLRLVDAQGNRDNATPYNGKLIQDEIDKMYFLHKEGNMTMRELAEDFGISKSRVQQLISEHPGLDGITFSKWRNESIKGYGNAVVPQVVYQIFKAIEQYETIINTTQDRPMP